jgi:predicted SprT family Zn-dependent metalloprotease
MDLAAVFADVNLKSFDGFLDPPELRWNSRLRSSAGRFIPGSRRFFRQSPPVIEIASYLLEETQAKDLIYDTIAHEMIHYWLWVRHRPYGHSVEFHTKMREMGVSRYNSVPRTRPHRYLYRCSGCNKEFPTKRRLGILACAECCKQHSNGKFDSRFTLELSRTLT